MTNPKIRLSLLALLGLLAAGPTGAQAAPASPAAPAPAHPAIQPQALALLKAASGKLTAATTLRFTAVTTFEWPARNGQPLYYSTLSKVTLQRPNKLRVITPGDGPASDFIYDGTQMMAYAPAADLVAIAPAPPTVDEAVVAAEDQAALFFPFAEVIAADPYKALAENLTSAFVVGQSHVVGDTITDMVAVANDKVSAEIWIGVDDGLPRMVHATYKDPARSSYSIVFSDWRVNPALTADDFTSLPARTAAKMKFARPDSPPPGAPAPGAAKTGPQ
jgi:hypothetical protein